MSGGSSAHGIIRSSRPRRTARQAEELPLAHAQVGAAVGELVLQSALERRDEWAQLRGGRGVREALGYI